MRPKKLTPDEALVAKHFRQPKDLKKGDNVRGSILMADPEWKGSDLHFHVQMPSGAIVNNLVWPSEGWVILGDAEPPAEAKEALERVTNPSKIKKPR